MAFSGFLEFVVLLSAILSVLLILVQQRGRRSDQGAAARVVAILGLLIIPTN